MFPTVMTVFIVFFHPGCLDFLYLVAGYLALLICVFMFKNNSRLGSRFCFYCVRFESTFIRCTNIPGNVGSRVAAFENQM